VCRLCLLVVRRLFARPSARLRFARRVPRETTKRTTAHTAKHTKANRRTDGAFLCPVRREAALLVARRRAPWPALLVTRRAGAASFRGCGAAAVRALPSSRLRLLVYV
jgi:hypothetical protein